MRTTAVGQGPPYKSGFVSLLIPGPRVGRRRAADKAPQGSARGIAPIPLRHRMCRQRNPAARSEPSAQRRAPHSGCLSLGYFSLGKQREVTRSPGMASETRRDAGRFSLNTEDQSKELDPGLRRDDEIRRSWIPAFARMTRLGGAESQPSPG